MRVPYPLVCGVGVVGARAASAAATPGAAVAGLPAAASVGNVVAVTGGHTACARTGAAGVRCPRPCRTARRSARPCPLRYERIG